MSQLLTKKTLVLITGGFALAAQLLTQERYHVILTARSQEKGQAAIKELNQQKSSGTVEYLPLDVTKDDTIQSALEAVTKSHGRLDILVNNAAVVHMTGDLRTALNAEFDTNAIGPAVLTEAFLPLLKLSDSAKIIYISSGAGSISRRLDRSSALYKMWGVRYRASKAAMNMIASCHFAEYEEMGIKVFTYDPGFTQSNLSAHNTAENGARSAVDSVLPLIEVLEGRRNDEVGQFLHNTGTYTW